MTLSPDGRAPLPTDGRAPAGADPDAIARLLDRWQRARERRSAWEAHWQDCYDVALPQREVTFGGSPGGKRTDHLFDGTAPDAVDQLAASLLAELTPPWARWFGLEGGPGLDEEERSIVEPLLEEAGQTARLHFERSSFAIEMHQAFLDLVTVGTASILFEEAAPGEPSAFRFTAVPMAELVVEEGPRGRLDTTFRRSEMSRAAIVDRFPGASLPEAVEARAEDDPDHRFAVLEAVLPDGEAYAYTALLLEDGGTAGRGAAGDTAVLAQGRFATSPFITFRWLKAPGEIYGRSPVMKALPDIKTANKVVELILKNASISVTGIWQAEDDGVLNPATVRLVPGAIIPKAAGSSGLTPLEAPGRFDVSQLVLEDLRSRIRHALMADRLAQVETPRMTATEVLERSAEMARVLGATYGRLQAELLTPLVLRAVAILRRRGEVPALQVDGRLVDLQYRSPLARQQTRQDAQSTLLWLDSVAAMGPDALAVVDLPAAARSLGRALGVPSDLMRSPDAVPAPIPQAEPQPVPGRAPGGMEGLHVG